uniref:C-type lectin domain-containing protein n=1 Tax=Sphaeramia orbicularis TaxID=375764 RepID=A0A673A6Q2_9TELE
MCDSFTPVFETLMTYMFMLTYFVEYIILFWGESSDVNSVQRGQICLFASAADLSSTNANLRDLLPTLNKQIWNLTHDRDRLNATLTDMIQELERLRLKQEVSRGNNNHNVFFSPLVIKTLCAPCPEGWKLFNGSCYFFSTVTGSWETARNNCRNKSADLLIINTKEEKDFISGFNRRCWIGLSDREQEGTWTWVDGSPVTLSFWDTGEPNDALEFSGEDCAEMLLYSRWNDLNCNDDRPWICENNLWSCPHKRLQQPHSQTPPQVESC